MALEKWPSSLTMRSLSQGRSLSPAILLLLSPSRACCKRVVVVGAGWGGLSAAHHLSKTPGTEVTVVDAAPRPGGLVADSWKTPGGRSAEAGQHGFWDEYGNIYKLMDDMLVLGTKCRGPPWCARDACTTRQGLPPCRASQSARRRQRSRVRVCRGFGELVR